VAFLSRDEYSPDALVQVITYDLGLDTGVFGARSGRTYAPHTALFAPLTPPTTIQHVPIKKVQIYATHVCTHAHTSARTASSGARRKSTATSAIANRVPWTTEPHKIRIRCERRRAVDGPSRRDELQGVHTARMRSWQSGTEGVGQRTADLGTLEWVC
jgi:hypothetical protein